MTHGATGATLAAPMLIFDPSPPPEDDPDLLVHMDAIAAVLNRLLFAIVIVGLLLGALVAEML